MSALMALNRHVVRHRSDKAEPREAQERAKTDPKEPQESQERPKGGPREPREAPDRPKIGPRGSNRDPKRHPRGTQEAPKRGQESSQRAEEPPATHQQSPETPKSAQERATRGIRGLTLGLSWLLLGAVLGRCCPSFVSAKSLEATEPTANSRRGAAGVASASKSGRASPQLSEAAMPFQSLLS